MATALVPAFSDALSALVALAAALLTELAQYWHCLLGTAALAAVLWELVSRTILEDTPRVVVETADETESADVLKAGRAKFDPSKLETSKDVVHLWDPCTMDVLGAPLPADTPADVEAKIAKAREAQRVWARSSWRQRRRLMRTIRRHIVENMATIARVAVRDSGKTLVDAYFGEVMVTCEKLKWLDTRGEAVLRDEWRESGTMMMTKKVRVEYRPFGVIGAIVPWNYPFHNVFNPMSAALFSGNAIVIKVSEYASWSAGYYGRVIDACLEAVGAPPGLVQFVRGYAEAGNAVVTGGVDKLIFVGSPGVGAKVMEAAAPSLTPVVLELGGKDPFVVCDDADLDAVEQIACRGVYQNMGQNCAGPERFFVHEAVHDDFVSRVSAVVRGMRTGTSPLQDPYADCGAITMGARQMAHYQSLVDDAVAKGAKLHAGGKLPSPQEIAEGGQFYPPTVLADVPADARIATEEIFGPIMCVFRVPHNGAKSKTGTFDEEVVKMANRCDFALSSCAFSKSKPRAAAIAAGLRAGMSAVNDLEGTTYMSQSLPFGGCGKSGFDRFAGPEGLRGLCMVRSVSEDRVPWLRTAIPPALHYPSNGRGPRFSAALIRLFYGHGWLQKLLGIVDICVAMVGPAPEKKKAKQQ